MLMKPLPSLWVEVPLKSKKYKHSYVMKALEVLRGCTSLDPNLAQPALGLRF